MKFENIQEGDTVFLSRSTKSLLHDYFKKVFFLPSTVTKITPSRFCVNFGHGDEWYVKKDGKSFGKRIRGSVFAHQLGDTINWGIGGSKTICDETKDYVLHNKKVDVISRASNDLDSGKIRIIRGMKIDDAYNACLPLLPLLNEIK